MSKKSFWLVTFISKIDIYNFRKIIDINIVLYKLLKSQRIWITCSRLKFTEIYTGIWQIILKPNRAIHCINRWWPKCRIETNCSSENSSLVHIFFLCCRVYKFLVLIINTVPSNFFEAHSTTTNIIDMRFMSISPNINLEFTFCLKLFRKILFKFGLGLFCWWRNRNLEIENLVDIWSFKLSRFLGYTCPLAFNPDLSFSTII
jgi:hypothetical protein